MTRVSSRQALLALLLAGAGPAAAEGAKAPAEIAKAPAATAAQPAAPPLAAPPLAAPTATVAPPKASAPAAIEQAPAPANAKLPAPAAVPEPVKLSDDPRPSYGPGTFVATMNAVERYRAIAEAGGWSPVPNEATRLKPGDHGPAAAALRQRLAVSDDLPAALAAGDAFDETLVAALKRFQVRHGLLDTGLVGPQTLVQLNVPVATRVRQLQASAGRMLGATFPFGERYVAVNIPSATVEAVTGGVVAHRYVAIVGKTDRPSPIVGARVQTVNLNPTWTVPVSLIRKDIIPHMRKDPGYLAKMRIRILDAAGQEVDPAAIDWKTDRAVNYTLRQDPGPDNSLGAVRIDMPNKMAVYMHDTPSKRLFARNARLQSSGCVRVAGVKELARWLLEGTAGPGGGAWGPAEIDAAIATGQRIDVKLQKQVPVAWVYLTGFVTPDGAVHFRDDVYGLDTPSRDVGDSGGPATTSSLPRPAPPQP